MMPMSKNNDEEIPESDIDLNSKRQSQEINNNNEIEMKYRISCNIFS